MKKLFLLLAASVMLFAVGCDEQGNDNVNPIQPEPTPEGEMLASAKEQMEAIANSIPKLNATVTALNNLTSALTPSNVAPSTRTDDSSNNGVKTQIAELEKRIEELEKYIANGSSANQEWLDTTFATIDMYEQTITSLATLQAEVDVLKENISSSTYELFAEVDNKISSSCDSMKGWVSEQLSGYYGIAEVDALLAQLSASMTEDNAEIRASIEDLRKNIQQMLSEMRQEYKAAIEEAINDYNGVITAEIESKIKTTNERIDSEIGQLNKRIDDIEARLEELENAVTDLVNRIQSITYIPTHEDGKARVDCHNASIKGSTMTMSFVISPKNAVADIVEKYKEIVSVNAIIVGTTTTLELPITSCTANEGVLTINVTCDKLGNNFFRLRRSAQAMLSISDGNNDVNTNYISLFPRFHAANDTMIKYTSMDKKPIEFNYASASNALLGNIYDGDCGYLVFERATPYIMDGMFENCQTLKSISFSSQISYVGERAFRDCKALKSIEFPEDCGMTHINKEAFYNCNSLEKINIPNSVIFVGDDIFEGCTSFPIEDGLQYADTYLISIHDKQQASCNLKENTRFIGASAFSHYYKLTNITIPSGVVFIGHHAFRGCSGIAEITIPEGVSSIEPSTFEDCTSLANINIPNPNTITEIGERAFSGCVNLESINIGNSVKSIGSYAFWECSKLSKIVIPDTITSIKESTFYGCTSLKEVLIGNGVTSIGLCAFSTCSSLTNLVLGTNVEEINTGAFSNCTSLEKVDIPDSVKWILDSAFYGCTSLKNLKIGQNVEIIGESAFNTCTSLENINIPDNVTLIDNNAFYDCNNTQSVHIGKSVHYIGYNAFYNCTGELTVDCNLPDLSEYTISGFSDSCFTKIIISDNVTSIGAQAFNGAQNVTSIVIGDNVTHIGDFAFTTKFNAKLDITLGKNVSYIGNYAFGSNVHKSIELYISDLKAFLNMEMYSDSDSDNIFYSFQYFDLYLNGELLNELVIPDGVSSIKDGRFYGCRHIESVTLPKGVISIGSQAFYNCSNIESIHLPEGLVSIGDSAFCGCDKMSDITIPESVTTIGKNAFGGESFPVENDIRYADTYAIEAVAFYRSELSFREGTRFISSHVSSNSSIVKVIIPASVIAIDGYAFAFLETLSEVYCKATTPPTATNWAQGWNDDGSFDYWGAFEHNDPNRKIYVPTESVEAYKAADGWKEYADAIEPYVF